MSGRAPHGGPSAAEPLLPAAIADLVRNRLSNEQRDRLRVDIAPDVSPPAAAGAAMVQAIASLLKNAFDASAAPSEVWLRFTQREATVRIAVHDDGAGMSP